MMGEMADPHDEQSAADDEAWEWRSEADKAAEIVVALAKCEEPYFESDCVLCWRNVIGGEEHTVDCPWRRAREWMGYPTGASTPTIDPPPAQPS